MAKYVTDLLRGRTYGAGVYAKGAVHVDWWQRLPHGGLQRGTYRSVTVAGDRLRVLNASITDDPRLTRQTPLLGSSGQATIAAMKVAIVGAGGTGSHVAQALAYLGFTDLLIYDDDIIELSNLNRTVTADVDDIGSPKNYVAGVRVCQIDPSINVTTFPAITASGEHPELHGIDLIVGCLDHDGPRDLLNQIAVDTATPYIDIATGVDTNLDPAVVGGRVILVRPGSPCLHCHDELDADEITRWVKTPEQQDLDGEHGYGTGLPNASVVHLNGITVYSAITELIVWIAGTRPPAQYLEVDLSGYLNTDPSTPGVRITPRHAIPAKSGCFACAH
ncbi:MAG: ThiF family adenylyltransferase [Acidobacteria bacterium]|nr:ThiF family adenylyltransferase [Acidobacteriota bacterium]